MIQNLQPYEKFLTLGAAQLTDEELLAIILRTGTRQRDALGLAKDVLGLSDSGKNRLLGLHHLTMEKLKEIPGIGDVKATKLLCITEISKRISMANAEKGLSFHSPSSIAAYFMEELRHLEEECLILVSLDIKGRLLSYETISKGSVRGSMVPAREIFMHALQRKAVSIILLHNHPSGDASPSLADLESTQHIAELGDMLGIPLLDHIIIGDRIYHSFLEEGYLESEDN